jgi:predicted nucleotidyltransferase
MVFEQALAEAAKGTGIKLLVLFGSRARGEVHPHSDWDFSYIGDGRFDVDLLRDRFLVEKAAAVERHLKRVAECLPATAEELRPMTDASDAVILHLWQAVQIVIDMAVSACVRLGHGALQAMGTPFANWLPLRSSIARSPID